MKRSRNRVTPFLVAILVVLVWILIFSVIYKFIQNNNRRRIKRLKLDDDLVQELYSYITANDLLVYSKKEYNINNLPIEFIFSKATDFMTLEDIELNSKNEFKISYESLDSAIKTAFGPDIKYDLSDINGKIETNFEINDKKLLFNVKYDKSNKVYYGNYETIKDTKNVNVKKELVQATKTNTVNLKIAYVIYKNGDKIQICSDNKCTKIEKEIDNFDNYKYDKYVTVSLKKASDEVYYYDSNE